MKQPITPRDTPRDFCLTEKFFSITDDRGVIQCGNDVFMRVSSYAPDELLQKPHNIIRHPDMPRCVFKLLWDYLDAGKEIGAYVKNMAKTGEYYWVYALVTPVQAGYCSIRIKPSSGIFPIVQELYAELLKHENEHKGNPREAMESATSLLVTRLNGLGFKDYNEFMCTSLRTEMSLHNQALEVAEIEKAGIVHVDPAMSDDMQLLRRTFANLDRLSELSEQIKVKQGAFSTLNEDLHSISSNTRFRSARLGEDGRTLGVISDEIERARLKLQTEFNSLDSDIDKVNAAINGASLHASLSLLQVQTQHEFESSMLAHPSSEAEQIANYGWSVQDINAALETSSWQSFERFMNEIRNLIKSLSELSNFILFLSRTIQVLDYCYVTGKSLSAPMESAKEFIDILADLKEVAQDSAHDLGELQDYVDGAKGLVA